MPVSAKVVPITLFLPRGSFSMSTAMIIVKTGPEACMMALTWESVIVMP